MATRKIEVAIIGDASSLQRAFGKAGVAGNAWGKSMDRAGRYVSRGFTAAGVGIAAGIGASVKVAADFEKTLSGVEAVSGATTAQMAKLRAGALRYGASSTFSAKEVAEAQRELAKAGLTTAQILSGGLNSAMTLAAAGEMSVAEAAVYTANAMEAFGLAGKDTAKIANGFAVAANITTADVKDFGMALNQTVAAARAAGLSYNETMLSLTALAKIGVKGSDAGTSLKTTLTQLAKPTAQAKKEMDKLGVSFFDSNGQFRSMVDVSGQLKQSWSKLTAQERLASATRLAGTDGQRTLLALYQAGPQALSKWGAALTKQGAAQKMVQKQTDNLSSDFKKLTNALEVAGILIGEQLIPPLSEAAVELGKFLQTSANDGSLDQLGAGLREGVAGLAQFASAVVQVMPTVLQLTGIFLDIATNPVAATFTAAAVAAVLVTRAVQALTVQMTILRGAMAAHPLMAFVAVAATLGAILGTVITETTGTTSAMEQLARATDRARTAQEALRDALAGEQDAHLQLQRSLLSRSQAMDNLAQTQERVRSGELRGRAATLALRDAKLRVQEAELGVTRAQKAAGKAADESLQKFSEMQKAHYDRRRAAEEELKQSVAGVRANGANAQSMDRLKAAYATYQRVAKGNVTEARKMLPALNAVAKSNGVGAAQARAYIAQIQSMSPKMANTASTARTLASANALLKGASDKGAGGVNNLSSSVAALGGKMSGASAGAQSAGYMIGAGLAAGMAASVVLVEVQAARMVAAAERAAKAKARIKSPSRLFAEEIGGPLAQGVAMGIRQQGMKVQKALTDTVRNAVLDAKRNLSGLTSGFAGMVGTAIDEQTRRRTGALANDPEAIRLREMEAAKNAEQVAAERARLQDDLRTARGTKAKEEAAKALADFERDLEMDRLRDSLDAKEQAIRDEADARKEGFERGIADLTDAFNRGLITERQYQDRLKALLKDQLPEYQQVGELLGTAFAAQFGEQLKAVLWQARNLAGGYQLGGGSGGSGPGTQDPFDTQMQDWADRERALANTLQDAKSKLASARSQLKNAQAAVKEGDTTPGERRRLASATEAEAKAERAVAAADKALKAHRARKPKRLGDGGVAWGPTHALIGERGTPEAVVPLTDAGVAKFLRQLGSAGGGATVHIERMEVRRDADVELVAAALARRIRMGV